MAIFHMSVKVISRSKGQSATAAAAYRAGVRIGCERGEVSYDYTKKKGVEKSFIIAPADAPEWAKDREKLWNAVESAETRKNSTVGREFEVAFPAELGADDRLKLVRGFARAIVNRHKNVVDVAMHEPSKDGDQRNHHAHILMSTRRIDSTGFTEKTRELDTKKSGEVEYWREQWAIHCNHALWINGHEARVDHRSLDEQGIEREPQRHVGELETRIARQAAKKLKNQREKDEQLRQEAPENAITVTQSARASEVTLDAPENAPEASGDDIGAVAKAMSAAAQSGAFSSMMNPMQMLRAKQQQKQLEQALKPEQETPVKRRDDDDYSPSM